MQNRTWSWASSQEVVEERLRLADRLAGLRLQAVRYFTIDFRRWERMPEYRGPREITADHEWLEPTWRYQNCDSMEYGLELEAESGRVFSVTWDPLGDHEGIGIDEAPLVASTLTADADVAVWDVSHHSRWSELVGQEIVALQPHYRPWDPSGGFWCSRITVRFQSVDVEVLLAQGSENGEVEPSADSVAVLFPPTPLPVWETREPI